MIHRVMQLYEIVRWFIFLVYNVPHLFHASHLTVTGLQ